MSSSPEYEALTITSDLAIEYSLRIRREAAAAASKLAWLRMASDRAIVEARKCRHLTGPQLETNYLWGNISLTDTQRQEARQYWLSLMDGHAPKDPGTVQSALANTSLQIQDAVTCAIVIFLLEGLDYGENETPFD